MAREAVEIFHIPSAKPLASRMIFKGAVSVLRIEVVEATFMYGNDLLVYS